MGCWSRSEEEQENEQAKEGLKTKRLGAVGVGVARHPSLPAILLRNLTADPSLIAAAFNQGSNRLSTTETNYKSESYIQLVKRQ